MRGTSDMRSRFCLHQTLTFFVAATLLWTRQALPAAPPIAPVEPVSDHYFGTEVVDPYRYMEQSENPRVQEWMKSQADYTRGILDHVPGRAALLTRLRELDSVDTDRHGFERRGERYFYLLDEPGASLSKLVYREGLKGAEHVLVDPAQLGVGKTTHYALDFFEPSWDGKYVAYGVSAGGSEQSVLHVLAVDSGQVLTDEIDRTGDSVVAWRPDNQSFFYLRYAKPTPQTPLAERMYNARTYLHVIGQSPGGESDPVVFGRGVAPKLQVPEGQVTYIVTAPDSPYAIAVANHNDDQNPSTVYVAPLTKVTDHDTPWRKIADVEDGISEVQPHGNTLYVLSLKNAPNFQILALDLERPDLRSAHVVVPQGHGVVTGFGVAKEGLYVRVLEGAGSTIQHVGFDGRNIKPVPLPLAGRSGEPITDPRADGALFRMQGWVQSPIELYFDPATGGTRDTGLVPPSKIDASQIEAKEVFATGLDGTRIPLSLVYRKGLQLDGTHPTILVGYGAYGISLEPTFQGQQIAWLERGGVYAIAHVRGGGEFGEAWHRGGFKLTKTNTVFDFVACGQYLVDAHYTAPRYLAADSGSAGGITVGGAMTWRPDLFSVILIRSGMSDTLRSETEPNGPPNISEFGSIKTEDGFHGLYAMSPYLHIRDGVAYPAVLFATGAHDPRVSPWHMAKMTARMQAATSSHRPVLLRVDYDAGHGMGSTREQLREYQADRWSFALWQMGDPAFQPK